VLPQVADFRSGWGNVSLPGLWCKLFDPVTDRMRVEPLWRSPALALGGTWLCCAVVIGIVVWFTRRIRSRDDADEAFAVTVTAMLLVPPLPWDPYLLLLVLPLAIAWTRLPPSGALPMHWLFVTLMAAFWLDTDLLWNYWLPGAYRHHVAGPVHTLALL